MTKSQPQLLRHQHRTKKTFKSLVCDYCESGASCESGKCNTSINIFTEKSINACYGTSGKMPTYCPSNSDMRHARGPCANDIECESDRCVSQWITGKTSCYGKRCSEDSNCKSNNCDWEGFPPTLTCQEKQANGDSCYVHDNCKSNNCNIRFICSDRKANGGRCLRNSDCQSSNCALNLEVGEYLCS